MYKFVLIAALLISTYIQAITFPILSYSKETGVILGLFSIKEFDNNSSQQLFFMTQNKGQAGAVNLQNLPISEERINVGIFGSNTGQSFYGIANTNQNKSSQTLYASKLSSSISIEKKTPYIWDLIIGINHVYYNEDDTKNTESQFKNLNNIGLIIGTQIDKRDKEINSNSGYFNMIKLSIASEQTNISNDIRYFHPLTPSDNIASRIYLGQNITESQHIMYLEEAGGYTYLRGYKTGVFVNKFIGFAQLEWRKKITSWYTLTPFIEIGSIGASPTRQTHGLFSYGIGNYFPIGRTNLRLEFAIAESNTGFYFGFNHVF